MRFVSSASAVCALLFASAYAVWAQSPEELAARQCRSIHIDHQGIPAGASALYSEVQAKISTPGTYFCAMNFDDGYIGFQELADGKKVIVFSIWDPVAKGDNPNDVPEAQRTALVKLGPKARSGRFGGEGTGGQSFTDYPWTIGECMRFLVVVDKMGPFKEISGFYYDNKQKNWNLISRWKTHSTVRELSCAIGFIEDFRRNCESAKKERAASFGPCFAYKDGQWHPHTRVMFTGDPTPSANVMAQVQKDGSVMMQTGGETKMTDFKLFESRELPKDTQLTPPDKDVAAVVRRHMAIRQERQK